GLGEFGGGGGDPQAETHAAGGPSRGGRVYQDSPALGGGAPGRSSAPPAAELAAYVLWWGRVRPTGLVTGPAVLMSKHWMDKVWSWDHCFNALALAPGCPEL
ncbi:hypothetical protein ADL02_22415, partial [Streptomyces sp. NRRL WC-3723]